VRTRQVAIPIDRILNCENGFMVAQYLRGCGIDPQGNVDRWMDVDNQLMIYTETRGDDERPEKT
jgi:hypothetical protein